MKIESIQQYGLKGLQRGIVKVSRHSEEISRFGVGSEESEVLEAGQSPQPDLVDSIVGLKQGEQQTYASSKVLKTYDTLSRSLLDLMA
jgi:hypothetical protein